MSFSAPGQQPPPPVPAPSPGQPVLPGRPVWTAEPAPVPGPYLVLRSPQGLATALTVMLAVGAAIDLFSAGVGAYGFSVKSGYVADPATAPDPADLDTADVLSALSGVLQFVAFLATAALFIVWFYRVRCNGEIFRPDAFTYRPGWAIGSWFVPIGNLFLPYWITKQTLTASTQLGPDGSYRSFSTAPVTAWWLVWVLTEVLGRVSAKLFLNWETNEAMRDAFGFGTVTDLLRVVSAVLAVIVVRRITGLQNIKAAQGPYAAV